MKSSGLRTILTATIGVVLIGAIMGGYLFIALLLPNFWQDADKAFVWKRFAEESPPEGYLAPVLFAFLIVGVIFLFRQEISTRFKVFVGAIFLDLLYVGVAFALRPEAGKPPGLFWWIWVDSGPILLLLLRPIAGYILRREVAETSISYAAYGVFSIVGLAALVGFAIDRNSLLPASLYLFVLFVVLLAGWIWEVRRQPAALVTAGVVFIASCLYLFCAVLLRVVPNVSWLIVMMPVMAVALFYVGMMYLRDAKSVHWLWAIFLGVLRTSVYLILSIVFLLPGCQHSETQEFESKVIVLFDVSDSMFVRDDLPEIGQDPATLPTRQDKIVNFLLGKEDVEGKRKDPFIERVLQKTPLTCYRFGGILDETEILHLNANPKKPQTVTDAEWKKWLRPDKANVAKPNFDEIREEEERKEKQMQYARRLDLIDSLRTGTNIGGACLQTHKIESNSFIQAIIVVSDGQSNLGSEDARSAFLARVNGRTPIPVFTIGVGQFRLPAAIQIGDIQAPEETRPDDKFPVRIPVVGTNLHDEKFELTLEVKRVKDVTGKPVEEKAFLLGPKEGKFKGAGDHPQDVIEFEIDVADLKKKKAADDKNGDLEGEWHFKAIVPRNAKEPFAEKEHVTEPIKVQIQKRALRVLLFASGATREYQFLRTILYREMLEKRMEMCIHLQTGREDHMDQDVEPDRLLGDFPDRIGPNEPGKKFMSLSDYDVVVAFDPDWTRLTTRQLNTLKEWVGDHSGGVIFVAGPVFSYQLARPGGRDFSGLLSIYPVVLQDNRLHNINIGKLGHDSTRPYALNFTPSTLLANRFEFLKLDEEGDGPVAGWNKFFWNNEKYKPAPGERPKKGFYSYYPVERLKPNSEVAATFAGPKEARINGGKDEQPFIVSMQFGAGKTLYLGSGDFWRLRSLDEGYHARLWIKMARYVSAGATQRKKYGSILMSRTLPVGVVNFEAEVKGKDLLPLARDLRPTVLVRRVDKGKDEKAELQKFDLQPKPTDGPWKGYFTGQIHMKEPGEYEFQLPVPNTSESLRQNLIVRKPNPELDNVRTNFGYLYQLASPAGPTLRKLPAETSKELERVLQIPSDVEQGGAQAAKRLFFPLASADAVARALVPVQPKTETIRGRFEDLWDTGWDTNWPVPIWAAALLLLAGIMTIGVLILLLLRQWIGALMFAAICVVVALVVGGMSFVLQNVMFTELPVNFSYLLMVIVGLLGIEWLARKLLRLA